MNKQQILDRLEKLVKECHQSINRMQLEKESIPGIEIGLLENKLIVLYDEVQKIKAKEGSTHENDSSEPEVSVVIDKVERPDETLEYLDVKTNQELEDLVETAEKLRNEMTNREEEPAPSVPEKSEEKKESSSSFRIDVGNIQENPVAETPKQPKPSVEKEQPVKKEKEPSEEPQAAQPEEKAKKEESSKPSEVVPTETEKPKTGPSRNQTMSSSEKMSLHEKLAARQEKQKEVSQRFSGRPITDIKKAIGINQQVLFTKELFGNDKRAFRKAIDFVNRCKNFSEAKSYLQFEVMPNHDWDENDELYNDLLAIIKRKFA